MLQPTIPGPDPDTRTPKFRLPRLACDAHTHIFGPGDKSPYAPGRPYTPPDAPLGDFRALHRKLGVGRAVIVNASVHGIDNRVALDAIAVSNGTFRAVANIDGTITERGLRERIVKIADAPALPFATGRFSLVEEAIPLEAAAP